MVSGAPDDKRSRLAGQGLRGGVQGLRFRGLTRTKRRKMAFFEGCSVGWGGVPTGAGGRGGRPRLDSRRRGQGRVGLGKRLGGYPPELAWWTGGQGFLSKKNGFF